MQIYHVKIELVKLDIFFVCVRIEKKALKEYQHILQVYKRIPDSNPFAA